MNPRKMHDLFSKFGVVKDVFIPNEEEIIKYTIWVCQVRLFYRSKSGRTEGEWLMGG
ncbi:hypothetical protein ACSBR1_005855 [Camellia fascicularis]